jgi:hypothetical protein
MSAIVTLYCEVKPENYVGGPSLTLKCKPSEKDALLCEVRRIFGNVESITVIEDNS